MNVIEVKDVKKKFKVYADKSNSLKERALSLKRNRYEDKWVINGISFNVKKGESIGLIGHNGCGKSTTLKLLTRIMYPDEGSVRVYGRVSSLLELGAGFHPDMTGIENIYINASTFGMSKKEISSKIKDIVEFAELGEYIDNPVRTYSSGMYMRLAFAVAINVDADVLLVDEILAVGDVNFQTKCFNKMMEIKKQGTTIVLVSHSTEQIERICERSIWLQDGQIKLDGTPREVHKEYLRYMGEMRKEKNSASNSENTIEEVVDELENEILDINPQDNSIDVKRRGSGEARFISVKTVNERGGTQDVYAMNETIVFQADYHVFQKIENVYFGLSIFRNDGTLCYGTNMNVEYMELLTLEKDGQFRLKFPNISLMQGKYYVDVCIAHGADDMIDYLDTVAAFEIYQIHKEVGIFQISHEWELDKQ